MGLVHRCPACGVEMVVERHQRGRTVPGPRCAAPFEVPQSLDFLAADAAAGEDRRLASRLFVTTVVAGVACCLPLAAYVWWNASGAIARAREADRPVEPLLLSTRACAAV